MLYRIACSQNLLRSTFTKDLDLARYDVSLRYFSRSHRISKRWRSNGWILGFHRARPLRKSRSADVGAKKPPRVDQASSVLTCHAMCSVVGPCGPVNWVLSISGFHRLLSTKPVSSETNKAER